MHPNPHRQKPLRFIRWSFIAFFFLLHCSKPIMAAPGTEAASFLDIPVGAQPAALGSAYTSRATDGYATVWNPAGLAGLDSFQISGMHLAYLESIHYEFLGVGIPLGERDSQGKAQQGFGLALQYLGAGEIGGRDASGNITGTVSASLAAYTLGYGKRLSDTLSIGGAAKVITESISDASGKAYAVDGGFLYQPTDRWALAVAGSNLGTKLKLVEQKDELPANLRASATWRAMEDLDLSLEETYRRTGLASTHFGIEWRYEDLLAMRGGYSNAHTKGLSTMSGISAGMGLFVFGQEFAYSWVPFGDLGNTHYFTISLRFSRPREVVSKPKLKRASAPNSDREFGFDNYGSIYDILSDNERKAVQPNNKPAPKGEGF